MGRVYLPADDVERFGCEPDLSGPRDGRRRPRRGLQSRVAEALHRTASPLLPLLDRRSRACVAAMAGIYHRLLAPHRRRPGRRGSDDRVSLSTRGEGVGGRPQPGRASP